MVDLASKSFNTHLTFPRTFDDHPDSGVCSPPLWKNSPPKSPVSKAHVIARGQRELMEMVSKMPESCYELSLKDLVEVKTEGEEKVFDEMPKRVKKMSKEKVVRRTKSDRWVDQSRNSNGFLLKLGLPVRVSLGAKKKTKKKDNDDDDDDGSVTSRGSWVSLGAKKKTKKKKDDDDDDGSVRSRGSWVSLGGKKKTKKKKDDDDVDDGSVTSRGSLVEGEDKDWWKDGLSESRRSQRGVLRINSGSSKSSSSRSNSGRSRSSLRCDSNGCLSFLCNVNLRD